MNADHLTGNLVTVQQHILDQQRAHPTATGRFSWVLSGITLATKIIEAQVRRAGVMDVLGETGDSNVRKKCLIWKAPTINGSAIKPANIERLNLGNC